MDCPMDLCKGSHMSSVYEEYAAAAIVATAKGEQLFRVVCPMTGVRYAVADSAEVALERWAQHVGLRVECVALRGNEVRDLVKEAQACYATT
jgi:hypothetical protein